MVCPRVIEQNYLVVSGDITDTTLQFPCWLLSPKQDLISAAKCFLLLLSRSVKGSRNTSHFVHICLDASFPERFCTAVWGDILDLRRTA